MTALHLISSSGYYGAENMLVTLAAGLPKVGCRTVVGVFRNSGAVHLEVADQAKLRGISVEIVPCDGRWDRKTVDHIRRILSERHVQVVHTHGYKADVIGCAAVWPKRAALVATCHNWPDRRLSMRAYAALDRVILRRFDAVAAASEPVAEILRGWGIRQAQALPNGVDMDSFDAARPTIRNLIPEGCDRLIGFVGRMVPDKGGELLLRCVRTVAEKHPRAAFAFVGDGPCRADWEALARQLGVSQRVVFTGFRKDMPGVYWSFDALVLPSLIEATPMCLLEGMACRVPVVATRVGSVPKIVLPGVTGLLVEPGDQAGLSAALCRLLRDPLLARRLGEQGRAHVARCYSSELSVSAYARLYDRALGRQAGAMLTDSR
jgi:glycosyltransferase involved in cell wall biosynthesis